MTGKVSTQMLRRTSSATGIFLLLLLASSAAEDVKFDPSVIRLASDREPLHTVIPNYPDDALLDRIEGDVQVCFNITRSGKPIRVAVRFSNNRIFERAARDAVRASSYEAIPRGENVPAIKTCRTFRFRLSPAENISEEPEILEVPVSIDDY